MKQTKDGIGEGTYLEPVGEEMNASFRETFQCLEFKNKHPRCLVQYLRSGFGKECSCKERICKGKDVVVVVVGGGRMRQVTVSNAKSGRRGENIKEDLM